MTEMINVNMIVSDRSRDRYNDSDEDVPAQAPVQTKVATVLVDGIRCFYPRRDDRPGSRITFRDGGGFAVTETREELEDLCRAAS